MKCRYEINVEFFGVLIKDSEKSTNYQADTLLRDIFLMLSNNTDYSSFIEKYKNEINLTEFLEILLDLINDKYINLNYNIGNLQAKSGILSAPLKVFYDITYQCNLRCKHCFTRSGSKNKNELTLEEKMNLIDDLSELGVKKISIAGGEPLICNDFIPFVRKCTDKGIKVSFTTNATLITKDIIIELSKLDIDNITISLDGHDPESIEIIRGKNTYDKILKGLDNLHKYYKKNYAIKTTMMKTNIKHLEDIIRIGIKNGCSTVKFNCVRPDGNANDNSSLVLLSQDEYINAVKEIENLKNKFENQIRIKGPLNIFCKEQYDFMPELGFGCFAGKETLCISPIGDIKPCTHFPKEFICGNVRDRNIKEIWENSPILEMFRKNNGNDKCNNCSNYNHCRGGCRYRAYLSGSLEGIDPYCYLYKNIGEDC